MVRAIGESWIDLQAAEAEVLDHDPWANIALYLVAREHALRSLGDENRTWVERARQSIARWENLEDGPWAAQSSVEIARARARALRREERHCAAERVLEEVLERHPLEPVQGPTALLELADIARLRWQWTRSEERLRAVEAMLPTEREDPLNHASLAGMWAQLYLSLGRPDQAAAWVEREGELASLSENPLSRVLFAMHASGLRMAMEDYPGAIDFLQGTMLELEGLPARLKSRLQVREGLAHEALERNGDVEAGSARAVMTAVLEETTTDAGDRIRAHLVLAACDFRAGDPEAARAHLDAAAELMPRSRDDCFYDSGVAPLVHSALRIRLALQAGESTQLRAIESEQELELQRLLDRWSAAPSLPGGVGFLHYDEHQEYLGALVELALALHPEEPARALEVIWKALAKGSLAREIRPSSQRDEWDVAEVQQHLTPSNRAWLVYLPGRSRSSLFVATKDRVRHFFLEPARLLERRRASLLRALRAAPDSVAGSQPKIEGLARELGDALLPAPALESLSETSAVTVNGLGLFGYLPLELLRPGGDAPLGLRWAISYVASPALVRALNSRPRLQTPEKELLLLAAPKLDEKIREVWPDARPIPWNPKSEARLLSSYPSSERRAFRGKDASAAPLEEFGAQTRVTHIVAHGVHDWGRVVPAGIALAQGKDDPLGILWAQDVPEVSPLVVLSACGSARAPLRQGEDGLQQLGGAFLRSGARCVLLSYLDIDLEGTLELMETFHKELRAGRTPARALHFARRKIEENEGSNVRAWGLVHVLGSGYVPLF